MGFHVYLLRCADGSFYTGHTEDLERRLAEHQAGSITGYTRDRRPIELVFSEVFQTRLEALDRERQIKDWSRKKKEALILGDWQAVSRASASRPRVSAALDAGSKQTVRGAAPVIVLVRPQLGENIGKAARAMLNFGLSDLRLVAPRDGWPNPQAGPAASGADVVLERAQVFPGVAEAVADCAHVYATTVRRRGVTKPVVTPAQAALAMAGRAGRTAILFGPERSGLETDDVAIAREILTVPINPEFGSLNLAQAVILVAYEWSRHQALASPPTLDIAPPAPQAELDGMIAQLDDLLERAHFYFPPDRAPATRRTLRTLLTKPGWSSQEVRTLRGVLSSLAPRIRRKDD